MRSVMNYSFAQIPKATIPRSSFNRSHGHKTTFDSGYLIPFYIDEVLPADTFSLSASLFARLATPVAPIMDNMFMETFFFYVPIRLIWNNWRRFNGEQTDPGDSTDFIVPTMSSGPTGYASQSLSDYFGIPTDKPITHCSFWHRAYNLVYNEFFRDQNLIDSATVDRNDGPDDPADYPLRLRCKRPDYFTSCLPWPQKGPGVELPLGSTAPVISNGLQPQIASGAFLSSPLNLSPSGGTNNLVGGTQVGSVQGMWWGDETGMQVSLANATSATINSLRQAFQIQKLLERDARGGTRYTEILRAHFSVVSPDLRLQRPEFLGGSKTRVNISAVAQTSGSGTYSDTPQGNLAAYGTAADNFHGFTKSFTEHGVIIGLVNVRADITYQQGLRRMFDRKTRFDFYWPALAHIGEQAVKNKEIYYNNDLNDEATFGYQERWAEYRYCPSIITGKFRSTSATPLDYWHLSEEFTNLPALNETFITSPPPVDRVIAVPAEPQFIFDSFISLKCARPMPVYSQPGLIDHF